MSARRERRTRVAAPKVLLAMSAEKVKPAISAVIATYQRPESCERALLSALNQSQPPLEVLVCDDGSEDSTESHFRSWARRDERVRYLRVPANTGAPATARNLGIASASGDWVAVLDDDDEWLPDKLARQSAALAHEQADVVATNGLRTDGTPYFADAPPLWRPSRADVISANPVIVSSALVRRALAGFPTERRLRGIEDYAAWLRLADAGARFLVLGEPLVRYADVAGDRMSAVAAEMELVVARLAWRRARRLPPNATNIRAALRRSVGVAHMAVLGSAAATRERIGRRRTKQRSG
jgi:glycosyltransferase involved in cell wall biosynthesis